MSERHDQNAAGSPPFGTFKWKMKKENYDFVISPCLNLIWKWKFAHALVLQSILPGTGAAAQPMRRFRKRLT